MLIVSDIDDVFLPKPTDLLVNVVEARAALESLLGRIGDMFKDNTMIGSALGPALQAGFKLSVSSTSRRWTLSDIWGTDSYRRQADCNNRQPTVSRGWLSEKSRRPYGAWYQQGI